MQIVKGYPPNIQVIDAKFHVIGKPVFFCYGDTIYNPAGVIICPSIVKHEEVHSIRQAGHPEQWWERYIVDLQFRLDEEIPAHRAELKFWAQRADARKPVKGFRSLYHFYEFQVAKKLSSPLYGSMISLAQAKTRIAQPL